VELLRVVDVDARRERDDVDERKPLPSRFMERGWG
jgi:hypothetical protein